MKIKHNNIYLFLALACLLGIILIFIFDGYIGVYDKLVMDNGQYKQTVENDQWAQQEKYGSGYSAGVDRKNQVDFTYTIDNNRFSAYTTDVKISVWYNKTKIKDITFIPGNPIIIPAFDKAELKWSINPSDLLPATLPADQSYNLNLKINRGNIERNFNLNTYVSPDGVKVIPVPAPTQ